MGLIAVVYRAKQNLPFNMEREGAEIDNRTGAIYFTDPEKKRVHPREERQAVRIKLGTSYELVEIMKELGPMLGAAESVLTDRVLYDYSHSGDIIEKSEMIPLQVELAAERKARQRGADSAGQENPPRPGACESSPEPGT